MEEKNKDIAKSSYQQTHDVVSTSIRRWNDVVCLLGCGAHWVKDIKDNQICLNKQQIKDAVAYLFLIDFSPFIYFLPDYWFSCGVWSNIFFREPISIFSWK